MKAFQILISAFGLLTIVGAQLFPNATYTVYETRTTHLWASVRPTFVRPTGVWPTGVWPTQCRSLNFTTLGAGIYTITGPTTLTIPDCHCKPTGSIFTIQPSVSTTVSASSIPELAPPFLNFTLPPTLLPPKVTISASITTSSVVTNPPDSSFDTTVTPPIIRLPTVTPSVTTLPTVTPSRVTSTISIPSITSLSSPTFTGAAEKVNLRVGAIMVGGIAAMFL